ncbi:MAG TPA: hypothetical protein VMQ44_03080, partial [Candidatus Saccharimonadales bacterium]|nr:hypothetical protein [Candidatus Saccharimonadales bacterium]
EEEIIETKPAFFGECIRLVDMIYHINSSEWQDVLSETVTDCERARCPPFGGRASRSEKP